MWSNQEPYCKKKGLLQQPLWWWHNNEADAINESRSGQISLRKNWMLFHMLSIKEQIEICAFARLLCFSFCQHSCYHHYNYSSHHHVLILEGVDFPFSGEKSPESRLFLISQPCPWIRHNPTLIHDPQTLFSSSYNPLCLLNQTKNHTIWDWMYNKLASLKATYMLVWTTTHRLTEWGKPHWESCRVYSGIAQIAIAPPPSLKRAPWGTSSRILTRI